MGWNKKRQLIWYQINDSEAIARHMEKMAAKGWHLEKADNWGWRFQRGEPQTVRYAVTYFPDASIFDALPTGGQDAYFGHCSAAGWEYVSAYGPIQYFRSALPDPAPIETNEGEKLRAVHRSMKKTLVLSNALLILSESLSLWTRWASFRLFPMRSLSSSSDISLMLLLVTMLLYCAGSLTDYFVWYIRSKRSVARGGACAKVHTKAHRVAGLILLAAVGVELFALVLEWANPAMRPILLYSFGGVALLLAGTQGMLWLLKKRGCSREAARWGFIAACVVLAVLFAFGMVPFARHTVQSGVGQKTPAYTYTDSRGWTWDIHRDQLPLTLEDLGFPVTEADHCSYELEEKRSPLAAYTKLSQWAMSRESSLTGLNCQVCVISWDWMREWCWQRLLVFYDRYSPYTYVQPLPEGVIEARRAGDTYILLCEDRVLTVFPGWEMTAEQLEAIVLRLSGV